MVLQKEWGRRGVRPRARFRKLAAHPDGLDPRRVATFAERADALSRGASKIRSLVRTIEKLKGEKAIVFTQFRATQDEDRDGAARGRTRRGRVPR
jgi:hypothetical protein